MFWARSALCGRGSQPRVVRERVCAVGSPNSAVWEAIVERSWPTVGLASLRCAPFRNAETVGPRSAHAARRAPRVEFDGDLLSPYCSSHGRFPNGRTPYDSKRSFPKTKIVRPTNRRLKTKTRQTHEAVCSYKQKAYASEAKRTMAKVKVVLAYSGGLDTSVAIRWINQKYNLDVIAVTVDVGNEKDFEVVRQKALRTGAIQAFIHDAKDAFVRDFVIPSLQARTLYQGVYPLATALARPLIAKILVDYARQEGAGYVAHGCTGKGNDQVRFDVSIQALAPDLKIIAPVREWRMTRDEEIRYAQEHNIPVPVTAASPYSVDANLWGRSIEAGVLEDPWNEPPEA